jgi:hypothetical protein
VDRVRSSPAVCIGNNCPFAVQSFFAVRNTSLPCAFLLCRAPEHGKDTLSCQLSFAVHQGTSNPLCHVLTHGKDPSMLEHQPMTCHDRAWPQMLKKIGGTQSARPNPQKQTSTGSTLTPKTPRWQRRSREFLCAVISCGSRIGRN